jgi:hypothetical protein
MKLQLTWFLELFVNSLAIPSAALEETKTSRKLWIQDVEDDADESTPDSTSGAITHLFPIRNVLFCLQISLVSQSGARRDHLPSLVGLFAAISRLVLGRSTNTGSR